MMNRFFWDIVSQKRGIGNQKMRENERAAAPGLDPVKQKTARRGCRRAGGCGVYFFELSTGDGLRQGRFGFGDRAVRADAVNGVGVGGGDRIGHGGFRFF